MMSNFQLGGVLTNEHWWQGDVCFIPKRRAPACSKGCCISGHHRRSFLDHLLAGYGVNLNHTFYHAEGKKRQTQSSYNWGHAEDERAHHFGSGLQFMASQAVFAHALKQSHLYLRKGSGFVAILIKSVSSRLPPRRRVPSLSKGRWL